MGQIYVLCLGTFACCLGKRMEKQMNYDKKIWFMDRKDDGDFLKSCIRHCDINDRFVLLTATGGDTSSGLARMIATELEQWNLKFRSVVILPSYMEGGTNLVRAIWTSEKLADMSERIYFVENSYPFNMYDIETVKQGLDALEARIYHLINLALEGSDRQNEMKGALADYRTRCMNMENVLFSMGNMYEEGHILQKDTGKAVEFYQRAANMGHATAWLRIGDLYRDRADYVNAMNCYTNAAYKSESDAACRLGELYTKGLGVEKDNAMSLYWYIKAAKQNNPEGILQFACCLLDGRGVEKNRMLGLKNLRIAAEMGYKSAREELVRRLREDRNMKPGLKFAQKLAILVIESGFSTRMYATKIGYPFNKFQQIIEGKLDADIPLLKAIIKSYPNVDLKYLLEE